MEIIVDRNSEGVERRLYIEVSDDKIDSLKWLDKVADDTAGAISSFIGTTRNHFNGKSVLKLVYEAYNEMAVKSIQKIAEHIFKTYKNW
eukprot:gene14988-17724_t